MTGQQAITTLTTRGLTLAQIAAYLKAKEKTR